MDSNFWLTDIVNTPLYKATERPLHGCGDGGNGEYGKHLSFSKNTFVYLSITSFKPRPEFSLLNFLESTAWSQIGVMTFITLNVSISNNFQLLTKAKHHTVAP